MRRNELHEGSRQNTYANCVNAESSVHETCFRNLVGPQSFVTTNDSMCDERYDLLASIPAQGSDGMDTDLADEELAKQMSVEVQIIMHLATK